MGSQDPWRDFGEGEQGCHTCSLRDSLLCCASCISQPWLDEHSQETLHREGTEVRTAYELL